MTKQKLKEFSCIITTWNRNDNVYSRQVKKERKKKTRKPIHRKHQTNRKIDNYLEIQKRSNLGSTYFGNTRKHMSKKNTYIQKAKVPIYGSLL